MARDPNDNVIPFRQKRRTWTRPEDYGHDPGKPSKPPKPPKRDLLRTLAVWSFIAVLVAGAVAWNLWR